MEKAEIRPFQQKKIFLAELKCYDEKSSKAMEIRLKISELDANMTDEEISEGILYELKVYNEGTYQSKLWDAILWRETLRSNPDLFPKGKLKVKTLHGKKLLTPKEYQELNNHILHV